MNECDSVEIKKTNLSEQTRFRLSEITGIKNYFHQEINQRKLCIIKLNKHVTAFSYINKIFIILSTTTGGVCIISFMSAVGALIEITSACFTLIFTLIIKKLLSITRNKNKKHDKILMLAKSKLNSIEILLSQALIDIEIRHEEFVTTLNERGKYEKMKKISVKKKKIV